MGAKLQSHIPAQVNMGYIFRKKNMGPLHPRFKVKKGYIFFFFFLFMSDAHHGINSSTQKYQSTPSSVVLTSYRQDSGSPPFFSRTISKNGHLFLPK